ncbi:MAG: ABC transporter permease, partial [Actinomycetota bacterium]
MTTITKEELTTRFRSQLIGAGLAVGIVLLYFVLPTRTPPGFLLYSLYTALLASLVAAGLILVYRSARIINFAQIVFGGASATLLYELATRNYLTYWLALPLALLGGALIGFLVGLLFVIFFFKRPRIVLTVATIVMMQLLGVLQNTLTQKFHKAGQLDQGLPFPWPCPKRCLVTISHVPFGIPHLVGTLLAVATIAGMAFFFKKTRIGIAIRGSAENADRASLLGINTKAVQIGVWMISGLLAALFTTLSMPVTGYTLGYGTNPRELMLPLAAAVMGRMRSIPQTIMAAVGIVLVRDMIQVAYPQWNWFDIMLFFVIVGGLFLQREKSTSRQTEVGTWDSIKEIRVIPRELIRMPQISNARWAGYGLLGALLLGYPWIAGTSQVGSAHTVFIVGIIGISLVLLTGWAGQISLGHYAFVAVGSVSAAFLASWHWPFLVVLPIAGASGAIVAALVGIPALRIRGLYLAVATLAMGVVVPNVLMGPDFLGPHLPKAAINRPKLSIVNLADGSGR